MKQYKNAAKMTMHQNSNLKSPARGLLNSMVLSALVACVLSSSVFASASVAATPNLCSGIFTEHSALDALGKSPNASNKNSSKPAISITLSKEELVSRIDNLIELQLRIQKKSFASENEFIQALAFFERETKGLMQIDPSYQQLYKDRFFAISQSLKQKQSKADRLRQDDQRERNKRIKDAQVFIPKEIFSILHVEKVMSVEFSPDSKYLMTGSEGKTGRLFELAKKSEVASFSHEDFSHKRAIFSPNNKFAVTVSDENTATIYEVVTQKKLFVIQNKGVISIAIFSPDSKYVATVSEDKTAKIFDVATQQELFRIDHQNWVKSVEFSPDGKYVATASYDKTAKIYDLVTKQELFSIQHTDTVLRSTFSPDSKYVVTASRDKTARIYEVATKQELYKIDHEGPVYSAAFSPDSKFVVTVSADRTAKIFAVATKNEIHSIQHQGQINSAVFSPDGQYVATASDDKTAKIIQLYQKLDEE